jgi:hypothetical protein
MCVRGGRCWYGWLSSRICQPAPGLSHVKSRFAHKTFDRGVQQTKN